MVTIRFFSVDLLNDCLTWQTLTDKSVLCDNKIGFKEITASTGRLAMSPKGVF
jgi:hypothetical protein